MTIESSNPASGSTLASGSQIEVVNSTPLAISTIKLRRTGWDDDTVYSGGVFTSGYTGVRVVGAGLETFTIRKDGYGWTESPFQIVLHDGATETSLNFYVTGVSVYPEFMTPFGTGGGSGGGTGTGARYLDELQDVTAPNPADAEVLGWDSGLGQWTPRAPATPGAHVLDSHTDVTISAPQNDQVLTYQAGQWVNQDAQGGGAGGTLESVLGAGDNDVTVASGSPVILRTTTASYVPLTVDGNQTSSSIPAIKVERAGRGVEVSNASYGTIINDVGINFSPSSTTGSQYVIEPLPSSSTGIGGSVIISGGYHSGNVAGGNVSVLGGASATATDGVVNIGISTTSQINIGDQNTVLHITDSSGSAGASGQVLISDGAGDALWGDQSGSGSVGTLQAVLTTGTPDNDVNVPSANPVILRDGGTAALTPLSITKTGDSATAVGLHITVPLLRDGIRITDASLNQNLTIGPFEIEGGGTNLTLTGGTNTDGALGATSVMGPTATTASTKGGEVAIIGGTASGTTSSGGDVTIRGGSHTGATYGDIYIGGTSSVTAVNEILHRKGFSILESANAPLAGATPGKGQVWVRASDNDLIYTDEAGTDYVLNDAGSAPGVSGTFEGQYEPTTTLAFGDIYFNSNTFGGTTEIRARYDKYGFTFEQVFDRLTPGDLFVIRSSPRGLTGAGYLINSISNIGGARVFSVTVQGFSATSLSDGDPLELEIFTVAADVAGPSSSTLGHVPIFANATGKLISDPGANAITVNQATGEVGVQGTLQVAGAVVLDDGTYSLTIQQQSISGDGTHSTNLWGGAAAGAAGPVGILGANTSTASTEGGDVLIFGGYASGATAKGGDVEIGGGVGTSTAGNIRIGYLSGDPSVNEILLAKGFSVVESADHPVAPAAGKGQVWLRTSDNALIYTSPSDAPSNPGTDYDLTAGNGTPESETPEIVSAASGSAGSDSDYSRGDHRHQVSIAAPVALVLGGGNVSGSQNTLSRSDHIHALPNFGTANGTFCEGDDQRVLDAATHVGIILGNPHGTNLANLSSGTFAQLADLIDDVDLSDLEQWVDTTGETTDHVLKVDGTGGVVWGPGGSGMLKARCATTANITIATALNSGDSIDGVTLADGNRVLVKNQTTATENGIYVVGATPVRSADFDTGATVAGSLIVVKEGATQADSFWLCTNNDGSDVVGTNNLAFQSSVLGLIDASQITSGTFDNARISTGNVTQHVGSLNHGSLLGFLDTEHRKINYDVSANEGNYTPASYNGQFLLLTDIPLLKYCDGTDWSPCGTGAEAFIQLEDVPSSYTGHGGKTVKVNSGATALEFVNVTSGDVTGGSISVDGEIATYTDTGGKAVGRSEILLGRSSIDIGTRTLSSAALVGGSITTGGTIAGGAGKGAVVIGAVTQTSGTTTVTGSGAGSTTHVIASSTTGTTTVTNSGTGSLLCGSATIAAAGTTSLTNSGSGSLVAGSASSGATISNSCAGSLVVGAANSSGTVSASPTSSGVMAVGSASGTGTQINVATSSDGGRATGYATSGTIIRASNYAATAHGVGLGNDIIASGMGSMAHGYSDTADILASGQNAIQIGPGSNAEPLSIQVGNTTNGVRLTGGGAEPTQNLHDGDIWVASTNVNVRTGSGTRNLTTQYKSITIEDPTTTENITMFYTPAAIYVTNIYSVTLGSSATINFDLHWAAYATRGTATAIHGSTITADNDGTTTVPSSDPSVPAGSWILLKTTTGGSGTPTELHVTVQYTEGRT